MNKISFHVQCEPSKIGHLNRPNLMSNPDGKSFNISQSTIKTRHAFCSRNSLTFFTQHSETKMVIFKEVI